MLKILLITGGIAGLFSTALVSTAPEFKTSLISTAGKYVPLPDAAHQPQPGSKMVFDITGAGEPTEIVKGLDRVAMFLNLAAENGPVTSGSFEMSVVLHGDATAAALADDAFGGVNEGAQNPNLPLIKELKKHGVRFYVCGQALARKQFPLDGVADDVTVAVSALTVIVNEQNRGAAYVPFH